MPVLLLIAALLYSEFTQARLLPRWEAGAVVGGVVVPEYPGSKNNISLPLAFPLFRYRDPKYLIDESGATRWLHNSARFAVDISASGGPPVPRRTDGVKEGMPQLAPTVQFGPRLALKLFRSGNKSLTLYTPLRAVTSLDLDEFRYRGWSTDPFLYFFDYENGDQRWEYGLTLGPRFSSAGFHDYYYGVAPEYATATRAAYQGQTGYSGSRFTIYAHKGWGNWWIKGVLRYDWLDGADYLKSGVVETDRYFVAFLAVGWMFLSSDEKVDITAGASAR